jgi:hypothetical protein
MHKSSEKPIFKQNGKKKPGSDAIACTQNQVS